MANQVAVHEKGFTVLYEALHPTIDVVFVHGFNGHPKDTWKWKGGKGQSTKRAGKNGQDGEPSDALRRSKVGALLSFSGSHRTPSSAECSTAHSSRTPTTSDTNHGNRAEAGGHRPGDVYWPADLVPMTIPDSRILTYGYDTKVRHWTTGQVSRKTVYDHAWDLLCSLEALRRGLKERHRPLLFLVHSLGGLVIKEALRRSRACASTKPHLHGIFEATVGVLFFGTPHRGADPRNFFHHFLEASVQTFGFQVNSQIVNTLMPKAERLTELRDEFSVMCHQRNWKIYSFQEEYGITAFFGKQVVDDTSSGLNDPTVETIQHISGNHMDMCRFFGLEDPEYLKVAAAMTLILGTIKNGTNTISREPSIVHEQLQDTSLIPETRKKLVMSVSYSIDATTKQALIDQLYFTKIDELLTSLTPAQGKTCRWFLAKSEYRSWRDVSQQPDHGGLLWIKGNPGTGKSTLIKFLFEEAELNARGDSSQITLSFFFLARGTVEEKSTTGLYRALLHQLFGKAVELRDSLEWMTADGARAILRNGWHEEALKRTLTYAIQKLGSRSLTIFIDALDECNKSQVPGMICFFEELCDRASDAQVRLQFCFSSRHYPTVVVQKGIEVTLEDEIGHTEDIKLYIKSNLRLGKSKQAEPLRSEILEKSSGIFLWVVLVLNILNSEYPDNSISIKKIRGRLEKIPPNLTDLFEMILMRDEENLERLQICLKWILFATRPLKPQELYFAIQLGLDKECSSFWDQEDVELVQMKIFVRSASRGLAEVTRTKASEVQFIHESVRDFLLGKYDSQWSMVTGNFVGHSHEILRDCCLAQLNASISQNIEIPDPLPQASEVVHLQEIINLKFPFLEYSILNVLHHANSAQQNSIDQRDFLVNFPLQRWIFLNNTLERYYIRRYTESVSLLYIFAEKNLADLIRIHPQRRSCFVVEHERHGPPFLAALATGSRKAVQTFLEIQAEILPQKPLRQRLCTRYFDNKKNCTNFGRNFTFSQQRSVFSYIAEQDDEVILTLLSALGEQDVESKDNCYRTLLSWAAVGGHEAVVKLLLEKGAELETRDNDGETPLSLAAVGGHDAVVKLLLEKGAELETKDKFGQTPLSLAAVGGHKAVVKLLLEKDAELETRNNFGRTPLSLAAGEGHDAVVKLLLEKGAELETRNNFGWTPLPLAAEGGHTAVVKLLLEKGAELETRGDFGWTPLSGAAVGGHEAVVKLLLGRGAELETRDNDGRTPLSMAAAGGHEAVVKLLLEKGAEVKTRDNDSWMPLLLAAEGGHEAVVKILLEKGAELEARDTIGRTPLSIAAVWRHEAVVKLLLEKGAELETRDNDNGRTPLSRAAARGHEEVVKLLLEKGAEMETRDNDGRTPLSLAVEDGHEAVVKLLMEKGAKKLQ